MSVHFLFSKVSPCFSRSSVHCAFPGSILFFICDLNVAKTTFTSDDDQGLRIGVPFFFRRPTGVAGFCGSEKIKQ